MRESEAEEKFNSYLKYSYVETGGNSGVKDDEEDYYLWQSNL